MQKRIYTAASILLLLIFSWVGFIWGIVSYSPAESHIKSLLATNGIKETSVGKIEIRKFPFPKIILHDIAISDKFHISKATVYLSPLSVLKAKPEISNIVANEKDFNLNIAMHYLNGKPSYGRAVANLTNTAALLDGYPDLKVAASNIVLPENTVITFDIVHSDDYLSMANMELTSNRLKATGDVWLARKPDLQNKVKIDCDKLKLYDDELQKISILASFDNQAINLENFSGTIESGGAFTLTGSITGSDYRSVFIGHLDANHNDLNNLLNKFEQKDLTSDTATISKISADIKITPIEVSLQNFTANMADINLYGEVGVKFIGSQPRIITNITIAGFDSSKKIPFLTPLYSYFSSLDKKMTEQDYIAKFIPLRSIKSIGSFNIAMEKPIIEGMTADLIKCEGSINAGSFSIDSFEYISDNNKLAGKALLSTTIIKPELRLFITSGNIETDLLTLDNMLLLNNKLTTKYDLKKAKIALDITLDSLIQNGTKYSNINLKLHNDDNTILIPNISFQKNDSNFVANGNLVLTSSMQINLGYAYNSMNLTSTLNQILPGLGVDGIISSNGVIYTHGSTIAELLYNLYAKSSFVAEKIEISGYDIDGFIDKINQLSYNQKDLSHDGENATKSGTTILSKVGGNYMIKLGRFSIDKMQFTTSKATGVLSTAYDIYKEDLSLESTINFPLQIINGYSTKSNFGIVLEYNDKLFEKYIDIKQLTNDLNRRPSNNINIPQQYNSGQQLLGR